jgi:hypothetical protein
MGAGLSYSSIGKSLTPVSMEMSPEGTSSWYKRTTISGVYIKNRSTEWYGKLLGTDTALGNIQIFFFWYRRQRVHTYMFLEGQEFNIANFCWSLTSQGRRMRPHLWAMMA